CAFFFFSSRRRHTRSKRDWSSDVCSSDLFALFGEFEPPLDRARGLGQDGAVRGPAPTPEGAAAAVEEGEPDVVALGPGGDLLLRSEERRVGKEGGSGGGGEQGEKWEGSRE